MQLTRKKAQFLHAAIKAWKDEGLLSDTQSQRLQESIEIVYFDWHRLAKYSFWLAIASVVIAIGAILGDRWLMNMLKQLFNTPIIIQFLAASLGTAAIYGYALHRRHQHPQKTLSNEALFFLGVLGTALSIALLGRALALGVQGSSSLLLLAAILYALLGLWFPSRQVWVFALVSLGSWLGAQTGYMSGWGAYYLGMKKPLWFVFFGLGLLAASNLFKYWPARRDFLPSTRAIGFLYLFISLWLLSIFGLPESQHLEATRGSLATWSIIFGLAALASIYHGVKYDDAMSRGFGLTFLALNLYTRFFELFWDSLHKAVFFAILALSFWLLGNHAEKLWHLGKKTTK